MSRKHVMSLRYISGVFIAAIAIVSGQQFAATPAYAVDSCGTEAHITGEKITTPTVNTWDPVSINFTWCAPDNATSATFTAQIPTDLLQQWPSTFSFKDPAGATAGNVTINASGLMTCTLNAAWLAAHPLDKVGTATVGFKLTDGVTSGKQYAVTFPVSGDTPVTETLTVLADGPGGDWYTDPSKYMNQADPGSSTLNWGIYYRPNGVSPIKFIENGGRGYHLNCVTSDLVLSVDDVVVPFTITSTTPCTVTTTHVATGTQTFKLSGTGTITDMSQATFASTATITAGGGSPVAVDAAYDMPTGSGTGEGTTPTTPPTTPPTETPTTPTPESPAPALVIAELAKTGGSFVAMVAAAVTLVAGGATIARRRF